ncbi:MULTISPECIES: SgrR family transcriptional regulator [unclassified Vibrio]|uniref:SgrR family transcriptional regulator n=1 Tax=unclassified Vibrio TaxID=2614977 RepID=UPI0011102EA8|nr:SgrR family transcriptional regulator [Vibrio sp. Hep-1b-8]TMX42829.1 SgrR family transcriptional regulator [Vibrio sp. Hep-1b-8]
MSSPRLRVQFETLFEHYKGQDCGVQLEEITEILFCTRRNARIVLNKMEEEGWLEWHPAPGRGKLSQLIFKRSRADVSENLARRYLEEGKIGQALKVLDHDSAKLAQVVESYLGIVHQEGQQVVRLPYYRPLTTLNPSVPMRRSELHITQQIFSGLTQIDESEQLKPDLAHTWEMLTPTHWRFYIRPSVRFHNGDLLTMQNIVDCLSSLKSKNLYSHFSRVESPAQQIIDIHLTQNDFHLPLLLSESCAKIMLPSESRADNFDLFPIGTGPYKVVQNDNKRLVLQAFDGYFGFRPLLDRVEVWVIDEAHSSMVFPSLAKPIKPDVANYGDEVELDPGCTLLLLNRKNGLAVSDEWASYFSHRLSTLNLFQQLPQEKIVELGVLPAHGLKPGWYHHTKQGYTSPPSYRTVTIAYHAQHPMFPTLVKCIEAILKHDGLSVNLIKYELTVDDTAEVDIWIKPMGIATNRDDALAGWLLNYSDIEALSMSKDFEYWTKVVKQWQATENASFPAKELGKSLAEKMQLIPMFHCWLGVSKDQCGALQNAKCNALGWFDFSKVWVKPALDLTFEQKEE